MRHYNQTNLTLSSTFQFNVTVDTICFSWFTIYSTQFLALNLNDWFVGSSDILIIFQYSIIILLYYIIDPRSLVIYCLFSGDIYFSSSFVPVSELFCGEVFETFVILSAILLPIKPTVAPAIFCIALFEAIFKCICSKFFSMIKKFLFIFTPSCFTF